MCFDDYLLELFYLIDTELQTLVPGRLRRRGPQPRLHDSEVITLELAGEFLGLDTDVAIYQHFCRYHAREFPTLPRVDRTTFARQAANLWRLKQHLHQRLADQLPRTDPLDGQELWLIDSFPLRVCTFARAPGVRLFAGQGGLGADPRGRNSLFWGFRVHLRCSDRGPIVQLQLAAANVSDLAMVQELIPPQQSTGLGDRNYWGPLWQQQWLRQGLLLLAPFRKAQNDPTPGCSRLYSRLRQTIEVVIGQLAGRFHAERTWARDLWHLCSRLIRKVLSHTIALLLNGRAGNPPLQLHLLLDG